MKERTKLILLLSLFAAAWFLPAGNERFMSAIDDGLRLLRWYAREHVILCLVPAFFIAGAISVFVNQEAVLKYLGFDARKVVAYPVAAISGTILAVCSCTVLPIFAGIYKRGAGLGPAIAFLYSGPAINVLAIILTARVLGPDLGLARAVGAISFSILIGLLMVLLFRREEEARAMNDAVQTISREDEGRTLLQNGLYFAAMVGILIFANWGNSGTDEPGIWARIHSVRWGITAFFLIALVLFIRLWFKKGELLSWIDSSWVFAKQILPLLFGGVLVAGFLLGGPGGGQGIIPNHWVGSMVGGNSPGANLFAAVIGAFMYFATLTEVPILEGLLKAGMGKGPALALLLAGPALSLPNMLVIRTVLGTRKTFAFVVLVVLLSTIAGWIYGAIF